MSGWNEAVEAHLKVARKINSADKIQALAQAAGITITDTDNTASNAADLEHYLDAVGTVMGQVALISARMKITNKLRDLGLAA